MSFGSELSCEFQRLTGNVFYKEVDLFTKLQDALINLNNNKLVVDIIHGHKSFVDFQYNSSSVTTIAAGSTVRRELSDMLFIVFSQKHGHQIRLMYMQNKKGETCERFKVDLVQLHLLKDRCTITSPKLPQCVFGSRNILKDALLPSVGSYGVFFKIKRITSLIWHIIQPAM